MDPVPSNGPPPVVLGDGITALGVLRSLGKAGLSPYLASRTGDYTRRSRWVRGRLLSIPESPDPDSLVAHLEQLPLERAVLVPCGDIWCQAVAALPTELRDVYLTSMPDRRVMGLFLDKWLLAEALDRFDVPHPLTRDLSDEAGLAGARTPFFIKPRYSGSFYKRFGKKAVSIDDPEDAVTAYREITEAGFTAVLQEYVPGETAAHCFVDGFVDREGSIRALFARGRMRIHPPVFGNSSMTFSIPLDTVRDAVANLERLLAGVGYRGAFSAEFKRDPRDGLAKLLEVNCRPWWFIGFAAHCGVDITLMIYRDAVGLPVPRVDSYRVGERCGVLTDDINAYLRLRRADELGLWTWLRSWIGATSSTFALGDPLPTLDSLAVIGRRQISKRRAARRR